MARCYHGEILYHMKRKDPSLPPRCGSTPDERDTERNAPRDRPGKGGDLQMLKKGGDSNEIVKATIDDKEFTFIEQKETLSTEC